MSKITESARNEECQIRIDPHLCTGRDTTVACHLNGAGMGKKAPDAQIAYGCSRCHSIVDGHAGHSIFSPDEIAMMHMQGIMRTQRILIIKRLLVEK